jgi:hypothetical protein
VIGKSVRQQLAEQIHAGHGHVDIYPCPNCFSETDNFISAVVAESKLQQVKSSDARDNYLLAADEAVRATDWRRGTPMDILRVASDAAVAADRERMAHVLRQRLLAAQEAPESDPLLALEGNMINEFVSKLAEEIEQGMADG